MNCAPEFLAHTDMGLLHAFLCEEAEGFKVGGVYEADDEFLNAGLFVF